MKLHHVILSIIFVSVIILAIAGPTGYISSLGQGYSQTTDFSGFDNTLQRINSTQSDTKKMAQIITNFSISLNPFDTNDFVLYKLIDIGWGAGKIMFNSWRTLGDIISDLGIELGKEGIAMPEWFIYTIIAFIIITLVAMAVYAFFKWRFED